MLVDESYVEASHLCHISAAMRTASSLHPVFQQIQDLRDKYNADLVGLITSNRQTSCGCGSHPDERRWQLKLDTSKHAYFVTTDQCATSNFSFAHEIGHSFVSNDFKLVKTLQLYCSAHFPFPLNSILHRL